MPVIQDTYQPTQIFKNTHFNTIFAAKLRVVNGLRYQRERIKLTDGDFMDIDWSFAEEKDIRKLVILFHGLEGHAKRPYMKGTTKLLNANAYDCAAVNLRGCSGEVNKKMRSYHSGATEDVKDVVEAILNQNKYEHIFLCGFSLGGNLVLKYLGEDPSRSKHITAAVAVSTPVDLYDSLQALNQKYNWIYRWSFLKGLRKKYKQKMQQYPEHFNPDDYLRIKSLQLFDELYTAPANGFKNSLDYYKKSSSKQYLQFLQSPSLLLNAADDSFLNEDCYPVELAQQNPNLFLEIPKYGGHVGFMRLGQATYNEIRTLQFFEESL